MVSENIRKYLFGLLSLVFMSLGTALVIRGNMGCVPFLCPAYVLSCIGGQWLTFGMLVFAMHLLFVFVQYILLRSDFKVRSLSQIAVSLVFVLLLDFFLWITKPLQWDMSWQGFLLDILQISVGALFTGLAYSVLVQCRLQLPGDGLVISFSKALNVDFRNVRIVCDVFFVVIGVLFCVFYFGTLRMDMIGLGTLLSAAILWLSVKYVANKVPRLLALFQEYQKEPSSKLYSQSDSFPLVVTIARTHGSGGHEIGLKAADRLSIKFHDKEIITATDDEPGISAEDVSNADQSFSIRHIGKSGSIFETQSQIIRDAAKESCVIIGRCADYVLKDRPYCLNIFVRCDEDYAVTMIRNKDNLSELQAREVIRLKDNAREKHYNHYTGQKWKDPLHYDLVINTAKIGIESAVDIVCNAVENILKDEE
ncbi:MAG: cytidylate kinase family protein [Bacteroidales bacterium]|nr:cytidylate kinase family protein [Bacteroidales bacterium]